MVLHVMVDLVSIVTLGILLVLGCCLVTWFRCCWLFVFVWCLLDVLVSFGL